MSMSQDKEQKPQQQQTLDGGSQQEVINGSGGMFEDHGQDDIDYTPDQVNAAPDSAASKDLEQQPGDNEDDDQDNAHDIRPLNSDYGNEEEVPSSQNANSEANTHQMGATNSQLGSNEEEELKMKIVLYYHTLFQGILSQWFVLMQQQNYKKLSKHQYIDLNVKIQKSLILDFDEASARESAEQDWKIDLEREQQEKKQAKRLGNDLEAINEEDGGGEDDSESNGGSSEEFDEEDERYMNSAEKQRMERRNELKELRRRRKEEQLDRKGIDYERLTEFFFDLCLSWCQFLDIETFLFFINGVLLNITKGNHINVSRFKENHEIEVLSIEFINHLLAYRSLCQERANNGQSYGDWYQHNFGRTHSIVSNVEKNLVEAFKGTQENRILDIWVDLPPQIVNQFINQHFAKMDRDLLKMDKAHKTTEKLAQSIQVMEQLKKISTAAQPPAHLTHKSYNAAPQVTMARTSGTIPRKPTLQITNHKAADQEVIEKRLVGQLGDRYVHANLVELRPNSYLISQHVRLPVFGSSIKPVERTDESVSRKGFLLMKDKEFYTSNRVLGSQVFGVTNAQEHKYVLDPVASLVMAQQQQQLEKSNQNHYLQQQARTPHESSGQQQISPEEQTIDSAVDAQNNQMSRQQSQQKDGQGTAQSKGSNNIEVKVVSSGQKPLQQMSPQSQQLIQPQRVPLTQYQQMAAQQQQQQQQQQDMSNHYNNMDAGMLIAESQNNQAQNVESGMIGQSDRMHSQMLIDQDIVSQVYQSYVQLLAYDKNAKVKDVLVQEPYFSLLQQGSFSENDMELAVIQRLYAEEESADIQQMIAQFYNKFDELHEQSLTQALAKSPNKIMIKNEVKYRIPERWTKNFHKQDIVSMEIIKGQSIPEERGNVNQNFVISRRADYESRREQSLQDQVSGVAPIQNPILHHSLSSNKVDGVDNQQSPRSLSSKVMNATMTGADKQSEVSSPHKIQFGYQGQPLQMQPTTGPLSPKTEGHAPKMANMELKHMATDQKTEPGGYQGGDSTTDAQSQGQMEHDPSRLSNAFGAAHLYDWSEVAYLFDKGEIPEELAAITDPIEYNYLLVRLRKEFNEKHKSNYLKYMNLQLPYHSRRDEVGGTITDDDWENFVSRLEGLIEKVKKKRARIVKRRKKRGKKKFPRKTLFKPEKRINVAKDPLWREIFIDKPEDSDSESDDNNADIIELYKQVCKKKGIAYKEDKVGMSPKRKLQSAKVELANREKEDNIHFPPIKNASMHPEERPKGNHLEQLEFDRMMKKREKVIHQHMQKTAQGNFEEIFSDYPESKEMINIKFEKPYLPDPFEKETGQAARTVNRAGQTMKNIDHNYTKGVKKQINRTKHLGTERLRQSAMTAIMDNTPKKFDFEADAYLVKGAINPLHLASTGQRQQMGDSMSSGPGKFDGGKVYKFKNIHGDRGTNAGLSSQAQNQPPSSIWKDHPIPKDLMEPKI